MTPALEGLPPIDRRTPGQVYKGPALNIRAGVFSSQLGTYISGPSFSKGLSAHHGTQGPEPFRRFCPDGGSRALLTIPVFYVQVTTA